MSSEAPRTARLAPFSRHYVLVCGIDVITQDRDVAEMDYNLFNLLKETFGVGFLGMVGGLYYQFKPIRSIPHNTVAVPGNNHSNDNLVFLVQK